MSKNKTLIQENLKQLIGKTFKEVKPAIESMGLRIRVSKINEHGLVGTADFREDRVNLFIEIPEAEIKFMSPNSRSVDLRSTNLDDSIVKSYRIG